MNLMSPNHSSYTFPLITAMIIHLKLDGTFFSSPSFHIQPSTTQVIKCLEVLHYHVVCLFIFYLYSPWMMTEPLSVKVSEGRIKPGLHEMVHQKCFTLLDLHIVFISK